MINRPLADINSNRDVLQPSSRLEYVRISLRKK